MSLFFFFLKWIDGKNNLENSSQLNSPKAALEMWSAHGKAVHIYRWYERDCSIWLPRRWNPREAWRQRKCDESRDGGQMMEIPNPQISAGLSASVHRQSSSCYYELITGANRKRLVVMMMMMLMMMTWWSFQNLSVESCRLSCIQEIRNSL